QNPHVKSPFIKKLKRSIYIKQDVGVQKPSPLPLSILTMERGGCEADEVRPYLFLPVRRRETMNIFEYFFGPRVLRPPVTLPHIVFGLLVPRPWRPSPPPYGWSTGFIAVPRTVGRIPFQRLRPALP